MFLQLSTSIFVTKVNFYGNFSSVGMTSHLERGDVPASSNSGDVPQAYKNGSTAARVIKCVFEIRHFKQRIPGLVGATCG